MIGSERVSMVAQPTDLEAMTREDSSSLKRKRSRKNLTVLETDTNYNSYDLKRAILVLQEVKKYIRNEEGQLQYDAAGKPLYKTYRLGPYHKALLLIYHGHCHEDGTGLYVSNKVGAAEACMGLTVYKETKADLYMMELILLEEDGPYQLKHGYVPRLKMQIPGGTPIYTYKPEDIAPPLTGEKKRRRQKKEIDETAMLFESKRKELDAFEAAREQEEAEIALQQVQEPDEATEQPDQSHATEEPRPRPLRGQERPLLSRQAAASPRRAPPRLVSQDDITMKRLITARDMYDRGMISNKGALAATLNQYGINADYFMLFLDFDVQKHWGLSEEEIETIRHEKPADWPTDLAFANWNWDLTPIPEPEPEKREETCAEPEYPY